MSNDPSQLWNHDWEHPIVRVVAGEAMISSQLLEQSNLTATDLDGKTATLDERIADELASAYLGTPSKYRWPEPLPPTPIARVWRVRRRVAEWLRGVADRISEDDSYPWEDD